MKYLLDTHTFLWVLFDEEKVPVNLKDIIKNSDNEIFVSVITFWEISLKYSIGKLELVGTYPENLPLIAKEVGFDTLELTDHVASTFYKLPTTGHHDPFDRIIIWQALTENVILISKDKEFQKYKELGLNVLWKI